MKTPFVPGSAFSARFHAVWRDDIAVLRFQYVRVKSVSLRDFRPALAEFTGGADHNFVAARKQIGTDASIAPVPEAAKQSTSSASRKLLSGPPARICRRSGNPRCGGGYPTPSWREGREDREAWGRASADVACECTWEGSRVFRISNDHALIRPVAEGPRGRHEGQRRDAAERHSHDQERPAEGESRIRRSLSTRLPNSRF